MPGGAVERAIELLRRATDTGDVAAASLLVRRDGYELVHGFGQATQDTVFLLASITKPMTAAGVLLLRDRGLLAIDDPVRRFVPEFTGGGRDGVTVRQLLTHTSGLPDMLPEDVELRRRHAPLAEFVERACTTPLVGRPGHAVSYQSMGILLAAEIAERITATPFRELLAAEVFAPLGMTGTSLGLGGRRVEDTARCQVREPTGWDWNSAYWRDLGAPWGGAHATVRDVARFLAAFHGGDTVWAPTTVDEMLSCQTAGHDEAWGLGWMLGTGRFGRACSASTYGHYGATGTVAWHDPETATTCVLLTTRPAAESRDSVLVPVSDLVSDPVSGSAG